MSYFDDTAPAALARLAADLGPDLLVVVDPEASIRWASQASVRMLGLAPEEAVGRSLLEYVHPEDLTSAAGAFQEATRTDGYHQALHVRVRAAEGGWTACEASGESMEGPGGAWLVLSVRPLEGRNDIVERRERVERLIQLASVHCARARWYEVDAVVEQSLGALADIVHADGVELAWDDDGTGLRTGISWTRRPDLYGGPRRTPHFESLFGSNALGRDLLCFTSDLASLPVSMTRDLFVRAGAIAVMESRVAAEPFAVVRLTFTRDWRQWDDANIDLVSLLVTGLLSTLRRCRAEEALHERARRDALTGLFNREELYRVLEGHLAVADPESCCLGVLYGDLDRFKEVNDGLGHAAGDRVLLGVAAALRAHTRDGDAIARFGGDEFVVVCPDLEDGHQLRRIAERVEAAVRRLAPEGIPVGVSFGAAIARPGMSADDLLHLADRAMYARKRRKRRNGYSAPSGTRVGSGP